MTARRWRLAAAGMLALALAACQPAPARSVSSAEYRPPLAGSDIGVIYLTITSLADDALVGADSPRAGRVEMHETLEEGGVMKMVPTARIPLPAGEAVPFAPMGRHFMVISPAEGGGDTSFPLVLTFESGARQTLDIPVWTPPAG
jgi:periplasmic copper chaperone A